MFDFITIGSATQDIFIESDLGTILDMRSLKSKDSFLCFDYGAKIEIDRLAFEIGGGAINTSVNFSNLGFKAATIVKMGKDLNSKAILDRLIEKKVDTSLLTQTTEFKTGFSVILNSFEGDRTVLAHRGSNSQIKLEEIPWDSIKNSKWMYIAPLAGISNLVLDKVAEFADANNVCLAFNPGATQIKLGIEKLKKVISTAELLIMNSSEASQLTGIPEDLQEMDTAHFDLNNEEEEDLTALMANQPWLPCIYKMLCKLKSYGARLVVITNGSKGVVAFDGTQFYLVPPFPVKVVSTLGAGDAFSSTLAAGLVQYNWDVEKSLAFASANGASVVQSYGAQTGLKTFEELESVLEKKKKYRVIKKVESDICNYISATK